MVDKFYVNCKGYDNFFVPIRQGLVIRSLLEFYLF